MQLEGGVFSLLVDFGGCGVMVEGHKMNPDSDFGVGVRWIVGVEYRTRRLECYIHDSLILIVWVRARGKF